MLLTFQDLNLDGLSDGQADALRAVCRLPGFEGFLTQPRRVTAVQAFFSGRGRDAVLLLARVNGRRDRRIIDWDGRPTVPYLPGA
jgi:hypothetical protein